MPAIAPHHSSVIDDGVASAKLAEKAKPPAKAPARKPPRLSKASRDAAHAEGYREPAAVVDLCADSGCMDRVLDFLAMRKTPAEAKTMLPESFAERKRRLIAQRQRPS